MFSTVKEYHEYMGYIMSTVEDIFSTVGDVQYRAGYHEKCGRYLEYRGMFTTVGGYHVYCGLIS